jgi:integrase
MKGSIRARGRDRWQIVVDAGKQADGRRRQVYKTISGPKREAQRALRKLLGEIESRGAPSGGRATVSEFVESWLASIGSRVSPTTHDRYAQLLRLNVVPKIGTLRLTDVRPLHVETLYSQLLKDGRFDGTGGLSARTVHHVHIVLGGMFRDATRLRLISHSPLSYVRGPKVRLKEMIALNEVDAKTLLANATVSDVFVPVLLALTCGLRRGEILGLKWGDVDLDRQSLAVRRVLARSKGKIWVKEPKSQSGRRTVAIPAYAVDLLRTQQVAAKEKGLKHGRTDVATWFVCPGPSGVMWHPTGFGNAWQAFIRKQTATLRVRFHDLRHTHATLLLRANVPAKVVSERLGHATTGITLDTYSHVLPGMQEDAAAKLDTLFADASTGTTEDSVKAVSQ